MCTDSPAVISLCSRLPALGRTSNDLAGPSVSPRPRLSRPFGMVVSLLGDPSSTSEPPVGPCDRLTSLSLTFLSLPPASCSPRPAPVCLRLFPWVSHRVCPHGTGWEGQPQRRVSWVSWGAMCWGRFQLNSRPRALLPPFPPNLWPPLSPLPGHSSWDLSAPHLPPPLRAHRAPKAPRGPLKASGLCPSPGLSQNPCGCPSLLPPPSHPPYGPCPSSTSAPSHEL